MTTETRDRPRSDVLWKTLVFSTIGFALAAGATLGITGLRTSGFALSLTPRQVVPILLAFLIVYGALAALILAFTTRARRRALKPHIGERAVFRTLLTVTLWVTLVLTFLPLKGSEAFVRAETLTTIQLNVIGLAVVLVVGLIAGWLLAWLLSALLALFRRVVPAGRRTGVGVSFALLAVVVLVAGVQARTAAPAGAAGAGSGQRVAIIGVDGCDWDKLGPMVESGRLPNFKRLMDGGAYGPLMSEPPLVSPRIWTTISTGKVADKHGIIGFVNEGGVPVNASMRTAAPVWDIVSSFGLPVGVVGWYVTWPVEEVNGFLLSDRLHSLLRGPVQMLQSFKGRPTNERLETFGHFTFDAGYKRYAHDELRYQQNRIVDEPLRWGYLRDAIYSRMATTLTPSYRPALSAFYLRGVDFVQHFFWQYSDPEPFQGVTEEDIAAYGGVIDSYYVYTDRVLGRLLDALGDDVNVIIVSDHGFKARLDLDPNRPQLTGAHDVAGVIIAAGPAIRAAGSIHGATIFDVTPTALAVMGLPVAEDMDGRALVEFIREEHLAAYPLSSIPSYEPAVGRERGEIGSTMDDSIKEQLKSLGYIE
jgi:predicted AlkP superfamily phosphohydrolase/phosphomutase